MDLHMWERGCVYTECALEWEQKGRKALTSSDIYVAGRRANGQTDGEKLREAVKVSGCISHESQRLKSEKLFERVSPL
jgi:hypothetical protein